MSVTRTIPVEYFGGLLTGAYSVHGGVIRDGAGRIVSHLVSSGQPSALFSLVPGVNTLSSLAANGQLYNLGKEVAQVHSTLSTVLNVASAGAVMSGLGLVTSIAGFAYLNKRLSWIDQQLYYLVSAAKEIKKTLMLQQSSHLRAAISLMQDAEQAEDSGISRAKLLQANETFTKLIFFYGDLWREAKEIKQIRLLEDCYTLAFTGASLTNSEMRLYNASANNYAEHYQTWQVISREHIKTQVLKDGPQRLLNGVSANLISTRQLVDLLDFANATEKGIDWIDQMRQVNTKLGKTLDLTAIEMAKKLCARRNILESTGEHLKFLSEKCLSVSDFSIEAERERNKLDAPAVCISALSLAA